MPKFSVRSKDILYTCHEDLVRLFEYVVVGYDCTPLEGVRTLEKQKEYVRTGRSKTLNSRHLPNSQGLSEALDIVPYPIVWGDNEKNYIIDAYKARDLDTLRQNLVEYQQIIGRFYHFAGYVDACAQELKIPIRWGGDWDSDRIFTDHNFIDLPHFELIL